MVQFDARYLDVPTLQRIVRAADVVLLPYDSPDQVTSGVLTEAVVAGKPVVSTAFPHAVELLSGGAGILVPRRDPAAIARRAAPGAHRARPRGVDGRRLPRDRAQPAVAGGRRAVRGRSVPASCTPARCRPPDVPDAGLRPPRAPEHADRAVRARAAHRAPPRARLLPRRRRPRPRRDGPPAAPDAAGRGPHGDLPALHALRPGRPRAVPQPPRPRGPMDRLRQRGGPLGPRAVGAGHRGARDAGRPRAVGRPRRCGREPPAALALVARHGLRGARRGRGAGGAARQPRRPRAAARTPATCSRDRRIASWPWPDARLTYANAVLPEALVAIGDRAGRRRHPAGRARPSALARRARRPTTGTSR